MKRGIFMLSELNFKIYSRASNFYCEKKAKIKLGEWNQSTALSGWTSSAFHSLPSCIPFPTTRAYYVVDPNQRKMFEKNAELDIEYTLEPRATYPWNK